MSVGPECGASCDPCGRAGTGRRRRGLDDADEVLEEVLLLLLDEAALDAESGLGEVLAHVVLDALRPDAACVEIKSRALHAIDAMLSP